MNITQTLFSMQDTGYKSFHCRLMPTVDPDTVIGVRMPQLRRFAKELDRKTAEEFIKALPHKYYEENNLHGILIQEIKDFSSCISEINRFLPYINNWATCDLITPKCFKKHPAGLLNEIYRWISSEHTYTLRFGIEMLMKFYLDEHFDEEHLKTVSEIKSDDYYVNMMIAWYFATALAKQYDFTVQYLEKSILGKWVHNKTIQKAVESYRIPDDKKEYLRKLRKS